MLGSETIHFRFLVKFILTSCLFIIPEVMTQSIGTVTDIQIHEKTLIVSAGTDIVVFKPCTDNIIMIDYRPNGMKDFAPIVVADTFQPSMAGVIDTSGDPLRIVTMNYRIEIARSPLRFHLYNNSGQLLCEEEPGGGIQTNGLVFATSGGTFYGVHNRSKGSLPTQNSVTISAGNQGQAGGPFAWTNRGWGFLADVDGGSITINGNSFSFSRTPSTAKRDLEWYFIVGTPKEIIRGLNEITGLPPLFPKYTLGFMNTEWGIDQTELYNDIRTYRNKAIPIDAYILDFDWMDWGSDNYGEFRWGPKFPDGQSGAIVDTLNKYGMHLMGIRKPRVHLNTVQGHYCQSNNFFKDTVTDYFSGQLVGRMNFLLPAARQWYWNSFAMLSNSYAKGITGYWNDEADEYGGNLMFMNMQRAQYEGQRAFNNNRVWSINRNYYSGAQRYAYGLWSGDIASGFPSMADQRLFLLSSITLGVSWWGMDIGGFQSGPTSENYYRWIQFGAFVPIFRVHGTYNQEREPWYYGAEAESIATRYIRLRYRLMPYIYSAAWENHLTGISITRPLVFEHPDDPAVENIFSEWMFGNSLLVSPVVVSSATKQSIYLPQGDWYDFNSGTHYSGMALYDIPVTATDIPVFIKGGSIIPMSPIAQYTDSPEARETLILSSYPGGGGECIIYDDDGISYDYEKGFFSTTTIEHNRNTSGASITINTRSGMYTVPNRNWLVDLNWVVGIPDSVLFDGHTLNRTTPDSLDGLSVAGWAYDTTGRHCYVKLRDKGTSHTILVFFGRSGLGIPSHGDLLPKEYKLEQNFPNPFNPNTLIRYQLPEKSHVLLTVYDITGRKTAVLVNEIKEAGRYSQQFDASQLSSGIYFLKMTAGSYTATKKLVVMK
jgi:alpha-glucosidase